MAKFTPADRARKRGELDAEAEAPCPKRTGGRSHDDPDNSGACIYCGLVLDWLDDDEIDKLLDAEKPEEPR